MLFYTSLLITSLLVTLIILTVYYLIARTYKKVSGSRKRSGPTSHLLENKYGRNVKIASKPWGNPGSHAQPSDLARTHPAKPEGPTPWGWPGNHPEHREVHASKIASKATLNAYLARDSLLKRQTVDDWRHNVSRPMRDGRSSLAGTAYKPSVIHHPDLDIDES